LGVWDDLEGEPAPGKGQYVYLYRSGVFLPPSLVSVSLVLSLVLVLFLFVRSLQGKIRLPDIGLFLFSEKFSHRPPSIGLSITLFFALVLAPALSPSIPLLLLLLLLSYVPPVDLAGTYSQLQCNAQL
jgi:hypothetical protein